MALSIEQENISLSEELRKEKNVTDYWLENPSKSKVIGRCGEEKKPNDHAEPTKDER